MGKENGFSRSVSACMGRRRTIFHCRGSTRTASRLHVSQWKDVSALPTWIRIRISEASATAKLATWPVPGRPTNEGNPLPGFSRKLMNALSLSPLDKNDGAGIGSHEFQKFIIREFGSLALPGIRSARTRCTCLKSNYTQNPRRFDLW